MSVPFFASLAVLATTGCVAYGTTSPIAPACTVDSTVTCSGAVTGYSCHGNDSPEGADSSLDCGPGLRDGANTDYCCISLQPSTCAPDPGAQRCQAGSFGFSCTGSDTPDDANAALRCSAATHSGNQRLYCCSS